MHLSTLAEVRESVLNYIQVMARPMVLHRTEHPVTWTPVYADVTVRYDLEIFSMTQKMVFKNHPLYLTDYVKFDFVTSTTRAHNFKFHDPRFGVDAAENYFFVKSSRL